MDFDGVKQTEITALQIVKQTEITALQVAEVTGVEHGEITAHQATEVTVYSENGTAIIISLVYVSLSDMSGRVTALRVSLTPDQSQRLGRDLLAAVEHGRPLGRRPSVAASDKLNPG